MTDRVLTPSRRSLAKGAAWAVPAIAVGAVAPAYAASPVPCPTIPDVTTWTVSGSNLTRSATAAGVSNGGSSTKMEIDATTGTAGTLTMSTTINVQAGVTYNLAFDLQTQYGYSGDCRTFNTNLSIGVTMPSGSQTLFTGSTQAGRGGTVVPPGGSCSGGTKTYGYGSLVTAGPFSLTPPTSGSATLTYTFTMAPPSGYNNDDWKIYPRFTSCSR